MKKVFVVLLAAVLLLGTISVALPSTAAAAGSSAGSIVSNLPQRLHNALRSFFDWLLSLFIKKPREPDPGGTLDYIPPDTSASPSAEDVSDDTDAAAPTSGTTVICDSKPSEPTQGPTGEPPTDDGGTTMPSDPPGSHCDYEPSGTTTPPSGENG